MNEIRCPVCCSALRAVTSGCTRCQTPHHDECFSFMGGCAVFGCGGKAFGTVDNAQAATPLTIDGTEAPAVSPGPRPVFQRGIWQRVAHSWRALYRNAPLALVLALTLSGITTVGGLLLGRTPLNANVFETLNDQLFHFKTMTPLTEAQLQPLLVRAEREEAESARRVARGDHTVKADSLAYLGLTSDDVRRMLGRPVKPAQLGVAGWIGLGILLVHQTGLTGMFAGLLLIIALATRARGKQYTTGELSRLALPRLGRSVKTFLRVLFRILALPALGLALVGGLASRNALAALLFIPAIPLAFLWLAFTVNRYLLAHVVAAMGVEEEPGDPLVRSRQIVGLRPWHTFFGFLTAALVTFPVSFPMAFLLNFRGLGYGPTVVLQFAYLTLLTVSYFSLTFFQVLLYMEGRRQLEPDYLPFPSPEASVNG